MPAAAIATRGCTEAESAIAAHAARRIEAGSTVFVDASPVGIALALRLMREPREGVTVVTNSPAIACQMRSLPTQVIVCPGEVDHATGVIGGRWTVRFIAPLNFDMAFVSAAGVCRERGLTATSMVVREVLDAARSRAAASIGLIGSDKFGQVSAVEMGRAEDLDAIVTDAELPGSVATEYRAAGVRLDIAPNLQLGAARRGLVRRR